MKNVTTTHTVRMLLRTYHRKEMREWSAVMIERMKELKPLVACFNGKGIYEIFNGGKCTVGVQPNPLPGTDTVRRHCSGLIRICVALDYRLYYYEDSRLASSPDHFLRADVPSFHY